MTTTPENTIHLTAADTGGLGKIEIHQPPGAFALTPASRIALQTIGAHRHLLAGVGLDWGCGAGCLGITAVQIPTVSQVIGLDIEPANIAAALHNAALNGVADRLSFFLADSYTPFAADDQAVLAAYAGRVDFILANPPTSEGDDGFGFRRVVLAGARPFLKPGGLVFLNVSYQYGRDRIHRLTQEIPGFIYGGLLSSTDWVPFDMQRPDLHHCVELYAAEERAGGPLYEFRHPAAPDQILNAQAALAHFQQTGQSSLSQWQTHLFRYEGE
ncbi:MAG TPA: methyltransferase [Chloroflexota bacterium]|nr:methyltransferase [Chloroflexota bacterium]